MTAVLLDTCAVLYMANGEPMAPAAQAAMLAARTAGGLLVSPVSAWEIGLLAKSGRVDFLPDAKTWFDAMRRGSGAVTAPFTAEIAIDSSFLPQPLHGDPADRLLIATARHINLPLVTRDRLIRAYADAGHVQVIAC